MELSDRLDELETAMGRVQRANRRLTQATVGLAICCMFLLPVTLAGLLLIAGTKASVRTGHLAVVDESSETKTTVTPQALRISHSSGETLVHVDRHGVRFYDENGDPELFCSTSGDGAQVTLFGGGGKAPRTVLIADQQNSTLHLFRQKGWATLSVDKETANLRLLGPADQAGSVHLRSDATSAQIGLNDRDGDVRLSLGWSKEQQWLALFDSKQELVWNEGVTRAAETPESQ